MTTTTCSCQPSALDSLFSFIGGILKGIFIVLSICITLYAAYWLAVGMVVACTMMVIGVVQSIRASKTGEKPIVRDRVFWTVFYLLGGAMTFLQFILVAAQGIDPYLALTSYRIVVMVTAFLVFRAVLPYVMRRSTPGVHAHTAWVLAILMWPVYASLIHPLDIHGMIYDAAKAVVDSVSM